MKEFWDERYQSDEYFYGKEANDFLKEEICQFKENSKILCLSEGQGRNAFFLAAKGHYVSAVDFSPVAIETIKKQSAQNEHKVEAILADLSDYDLGENKWDAIIGIFSHYPPELRASVHSRIQKALKPDGIYLTELYHKSQIENTTGGPKNVDWLVSSEIMRAELPELSAVINRELEREIHEGEFHNGISQVVQYIGRK